MKGIDVSTYQGYPNWEKVKQDGVQFAILKASQGRAESSEAYLFEDSKFKYNITNATAAGIQCGVYHYFTAQTEAECDKEAEFFLSVIKPYRKNITLYAAIDVESKYLMGLSRRVLTSLVRRFCDKVAMAGYEPIVYTNPDWLKNRLDPLKEYHLWLALWRSKLLKPTGYDNIKIWQWGASNVDGISGKVDTNIGYFELPETNVPDTQPEPSHRDELNVGDTVRVENPIRYDTGKLFQPKFREYTIDSIVNDRAVISHHGMGRAPVHIEYIEKI